MTADFSSITKLCICTGASAKVRIWMRIWDDDGRSELKDISLEYVDFVFARCSTEIGPLLQAPFSWLFAPRFKAVFEYASKTATSRRSKTDAEVDDIT
ncbi:hypothetical protein L596_029434 [Steinernema carpocapsae]|uniref:Uncharacterized protein n=1 Tax=Steinernema carpocapsae TaxID=34508 RepID=A0A4U5LUM9_STECR|nr:hypothetical protein L596_029434 [Steinernema carpocapsae]